jgi:type IV fimbrial biogenesis protein FimT
MTAIEMLIVVAALGLLVLVTVPGSAMLVERYRLKAASHELARGLSLARSEAIKRGSIVRLCPSANGRDCRDDGDWSQGWLVFSDGNDDGSVQEFELIEAFDGPAQEVRIIGKGPVHHGAAFTLAGLMAEGDEATQSMVNGEFLVCYVGSDTNAKSVIIDEEGWVNVIPSATAGCGTNSG